MKDNLKYNICFIILDILRVFVEESKYLISFP